VFWLARRHFGEEGAEEVSASKIFELNIMERLDFISNILHLWVIRFAPESGLKRVEVLKAKAAIKEYVRLANKRDADAVL